MIKMPLHVPGYNYCKPYTDDADNIADGIQPVISINRLCRSHDLAYINSRSLHEFTEADEIFLENL